MLLYFYEQFQNQVEKESELVAEIATLKKLLLEKDKVIKSKDAEIDYFKKKRTIFSRSILDVSTKMVFKSLKSLKKDFMKLTFFNYFDE